MRSCTECTKHLLLALTSYIYFFSFRFVWINGLAVWVEGSISSIGTSSTPSTDCKCKIWPNNQPKILPSKYNFVIQRRISGIAVRSEGMSCMPSRTLVTSAFIIVHLHVRSGITSLRLWLVLYLSVCYCVQLLLVRCCHCILIFFLPSVSSWDEGDEGKESASRIICAIIYYFFFFLFLVTLVHPIDFEELPMALSL